MRPALFLPSGKTPHFKTVRSVLRTVGHIFMMAIAAAVLCCFLAILGILASAAGRRRDPIPREDL